MQKPSSKGSTTTHGVPQMQIVVVTNDRPKVEMEIENHIRHIRSLINKLHPIERQKYFDGFLTHLLNKQTVYPPKMKGPNTSANQEVDLTVLTNEELQLIRELSIKMEELYRHSGDVE